MCILKKKKPYEQRKNCKLGGEMLGEALLGVQKATVCYVHPNREVRHTWGRHEKPESRQ